MSMKKIFLFALVVSTLGVYAQSPTRYRATIQKSRVDSFYNGSQALGSANVLDTRIFVGVSDTVPYTRLIVQSGPENTPPVFTDSLNYLTDSLSVHIDRVSWGSRSVFLELNQQILDTNLRFQVFIERLDGSFSDTLMINPMVQ